MQKSPPACLSRRAGQSHRGAHIADVDDTGAPGPRARRAWPPAIPAALRPAFKDVDSWWTVLAVDPIVVRTLPQLVRHQWLTPNRITAASGVVGLASGVAFLSGRPRTGALLFEARFVLDCLDGKIARLRGIRSGYGHFLDGSVDFAGTALAGATAGLWMSRQGGLRHDAALLPLAAASVWAWSQSQRWSRAALTTDGAAQGATEPGVGTGPRRHRLTRLPSSVEAETLMLFVGPLTGSARVSAWATYAGVLGFYLPSSVNNVVRTARTLWQREHGTQDG